MKILSSNLNSIVNQRIMNTNIESINEVNKITVLKKFIYKPAGGIGSN